MFSVALNRDGPGYVAFGGLPPVKTDGHWASTSIDMTFIYNQTQFGFYAITPDAFAYTGAAPSQTGMYVVDSGTTLSYVAEDIVEAFANLFDPPARPDVSQNGLYTVPCGVKQPAFGVKIGGRVLTMDPREVVLPNGFTCLLGLQSAAKLGWGRNPGTPVGLLGDTFMSNLVVVHDVGSAQMRFSPYA
jgi:aspergillopepsin I